MPVVDEFDEYVSADGKLVKWMRPPDLSSGTVPGAPTNVLASMSGTTATITWNAPLTTGGSPITGYIVTQVGGPTQTLGVVFSTTFTGLAAGTSYSFTIAAVNDLGTGQAVTRTATVPGTSNAPLFPGHTRSKITSQMLFGLNEADKDPMTVSGTEAAAPETLAGVRAGAIRYYYTGAWAIFNVPSGAIANDIKKQNALGRIAWPSVNVFNTGDTWATATDGTNDALIDAWIAWVEESATAPVPFAWNHEPNFSTTAGHTAADYGLIYRWFRSRMDAYAAKHGGVGVYQWRQLSLGPILMAQDFSPSDPVTNGPIRLAWPACAQITATASAATNMFTATRHLLSNGRRSKLTAGAPSGFNSTTLYYVVNATANTFQLSTTLGGAPVSVGANATGITVTNNDVWDWVAADPYIGSLNTTSSTFWTANMQSTVSWCEDPAHPYPLGISEWGIWHRDPAAGTRIKQWFDKCLDGTHDIWVANYFNSNAGTEPVQWILDNVSNANLLDSYVALMKDPRAVHFWDLPRPDGSRYTKPAGATF